MIDPNDYYLICTRAITAHSGIRQEDVKKRIFSPLTVTSPAPDYRPGQKTQIEDDGSVKWTVTITDNKSPKGDKKVAFVVRWMRYREDPQVNQEPFAFNRRRIWK